MAVKRGKKRREEERAEHRKRKRALKAARLAPPEERASDAQSPGLPEYRTLEGADFMDGSMIIDNHRLPLPTQLLEEDGTRHGLWPDPVFAVVVTIALAFTGFIAYLIATHAADG